MHDLNALTHRFAPSVQRSCIVATAVCLGFAAAAAAQTPDYVMPPEQSAGSVSYRVGGIGAPEADAMRAASGQYPLTLSFIERIDNRNAYTANVDVSIVSQDGETVLDTVADGPLMLIELPEGTYEITATLDGNSQQRTVSVETSQPTKLHFQWNA